MARPDRITIARLCGTALNRLEHKVDREQAVADLRAITTRTDLLTHDDTAYHSGRDVALLLVAAGADAEQVKRIAAETKAHLGRANRGGGIGESR